MKTDARKLGRRSVKQLDSTFFRFLAGNLNNLDTPYVIPKKSFAKRSVN